jgi:hypothetical protein
MLRLAPDNPKDRFAVYRFFNGVSEEGKEGLDLRRVRVPLVKTFLLEHVASHEKGHPKAAAEIFASLKARVRMLDESFMALTFDILDQETNQASPVTTGFLEQYDTRFFAYYTCEDAATAKRRVAGWIQHPDLDAAWYSSPLLQALWDKDVAKRGDNRFGRLVFRHESIFDMPEDFSAPEAQDEYAGDQDYEEGVDHETPDDRVEPERRKARFEMKDRIRDIRLALKELQRNYDPLHALYALRLPSRLGRGSHDVFQTGQVTNRADSFEDHRNTVRYLYRIYKSVLESTEESAWHRIATERSLRTGMKGVPLIVRFEEPLSQATFDRWMELGFQKRNRFKLWGDPIRLGPTKVHVYGADRHLWQPINLEITASQLVAILPLGTCGNTFHRLVANIQQYVAPKIQAWVGSEPFDSLVSKWSPNSQESDGHER